jgi:excisionase family DNA binding protein
MTAALNNTTGEGLKAIADILTDETAAAYLGVESRTVRQWRMNLGLPFVRITSKVGRIRRADLDKWLSRRQVAITRGGR